MLGIERGSLVSEATPRPTVPQPLPSLESRVTSLPSARGQQREHFHFNPKERYTRVLKVCWADSPEMKLGHESVHVDVSIVLQLLGKLRSQLSMGLRRKVPERVGNGKLEMRYFSSLGIKHK